MDVMELGTMLVRLKGDSSKFDEMMTRAQESAKTTAAALRATDKDLSALQKNLASAPQKIPSLGEKLLGRMDGPTGILNLIRDVAGEAKAIDQAMTVITAKTGVAAKASTDKAAAAVVETVAQAKKAVAEVEKVAEEAGADDFDPDAAVAAMQADLEAAGGVAEVVAPTPAGAGEAADEAAEDAEEAAEQVAGKYKELAEKIKKYLPFNDEQLEEIKRYWDTVKGVLTTAFKVVTDVLVGMTKAVLALTRTIRENWDAIKASIVGAWQAVWARVKPVLDSLRDYAQATAAAVRRFWERHMAPITGVIVGVVVVVKAAVEAAKLALRGLGAAVEAGLSMASRAGGVFAKTWARVGEVVGMVWDQVKGFVGTLGTTAGVVAGAAAALLVLYGAYRLVAGVVALLHLNYLAAKASQLALLALTKAWAAALLVLRGVLVVYNAVLFTAQKIAAGLALAVNALSLAYQGLAAVWAAVVALASSLKAALLSVNTVMLLVKGSVMVVTIFLIVGAFKVLIDVAGRLHRVVLDVFEVFGDSTNYAPLLLISGQIKAMAAQWGAAFSALWKVVRIDADLTWQLVSALARLAAAQVQSYWEPVWTFVQNGFAAAWAAVADSFKKNLYPVIGGALMKLGAVVKWVPLSGDAGVNAYVAGMNMDTEARLLKDPLKRAQDLLLKATSQFAVEFGKAGKDKNLKAAGDAVDELVKKIADLKDPAEEAKKKQEELGAAGANAGRRISDAYTNAAAAIYGSMEATARVREYMQEVAASSVGVRRPVDAAADAAVARAAAKNAQARRSRPVVKDLEDLAGWRNRVSQTLTDISLSSRSTADSVKTKAPVAAAP